MNTPENPAGPPASFLELSGPSPGGRPALRTYRALVLARPGLLAWLRYEALLGALSMRPGVAGLYLRRKFFPRLFEACGRGVVFGCGLGLRQPDRVRIGEGSVLDDFAALSVRGGTGTGISLGERVFVGRGTVLNTRDGQIAVGPDTSIGSHCRLSAAGGELRIGRHNLVAAYCYLGGGGHRFDRTDRPIARQGNVSKGGVTVGDDCWIGAGTLVLDGARIGRGSVIGAGSVVTGEIPPYSVAYGSPARVRRSRGEPPPAEDRP